MKAFFCIFLSLASLTSGGAMAASAQRDFMRGFASAKLEFPEPSKPGNPLPPGRYPKWLHWVYTEFLSREPSSKPREFSSECEPALLQAQLQRTTAAAQQSGAVQDYFRRCAKDAETGANHVIWNAFDIMRMRLEAGRNQFLDRVTLNLPGGVKLQGLLALKGDKKPRPFVVIRLGIFSNVEEFMPERFLLMQLFDQGPFNVLVVENSTSSDYVANNPGFSMGGALEGLQNLQIARMLRDPKEPLASLVQSVHFVGMSLGGHGILMAAGLDALQGRPELIDGYIALCPVINLRENMHINPGVKGAFIDYWMSLRLAGLRERVSSLKEIHWASWLSGKPYFFPAALSFAEQSHPVAPGLEEGLKLPASFKDSFWVASDPWTWFRDVKKPVLVLATQQDDLVPVEINSLKLQALLKGRSDNVAFTIFPHGFHCTLPVPYHWNVISSVLNGSALSTAKTYRTREHFRDVDLGGTFQASGAEPKIDYEIDWPKTKDALVLNVRLQTGPDRTEFPVRFGLNEFDFQFRNPEIFEPEERMIERWLHKNMRLKLERKGTRSFLRLSWNVTLGPVEGVAEKR